ncbi:MAG: flavodoxin family protein [Desulfobulbaceae bacterium]|nr:flavodoxin family protein [Desulfobulbaceae bacterium]
MQALLLSCSPRKGGNTETLLRQVAEGLRETGAESELIRIGEHDISPCIACGGCDATGICVLGDEMTLLYDKIDGADFLIIGSPIYFYGITAQGKAMIDRCQAMWSRKYKLGHARKKGIGAGYLVSVAASKGDKIFDGAILTARYGLDAMNFDYRGELLVRGVDGKGAIASMNGELKRAREFGRAIGSPPANHT